MKRIALLTVLAAGLLYAAPAYGHQPKSPQAVQKMTLRQQAHYLKVAISHHRGAVRWCGKRREAARSNPTVREECRWHRAALKWTKKSLRRVVRRLNGPPGGDGICGTVPRDVCNVFVNGIHPCEGHWESYPGGPGVLNSGGPYYGGLQMDMDFQRTYGREFMARWGTANNWPIWAQVTASYRAYRTRGYTPWPHCGAPYR